VTHGDASLPNFLADASGFTGFVDCGRIGVADRYQDLALTCWSLNHNGFGSQIPDFLAAYGIDRPDEQKLRWYKRLDEFF
jgi:aminoglycoside 3'-phosphotransferase II